MIEIRPLASSSSGNCIAVSDGERAVLLDAGIPIKAIRQGLDFRLSSVVGALLSHGHGDHSQAAKDLVKAGVNVWAGPETIRALSLNGHRAFEVRARVPIRLHRTIRVMPFAAVHDSECFGYLIDWPPDRICYLTDSAYCPVRFRGVTHFLLEANYSETILRENCDAAVIDSERYKRTLRNHMSIERVLAMLKANDLSKVQEIHLLHLSRENSDEAQFKEAVEKVSGKPTFVAQEGRRRAG